MTQPASQQNALLALSRNDFRLHTNKPDFMANAFERVGEPLNLLEKGQAWFRRVYQSHLGHAPKQAMVLGVTPWLGRLAAGQHEQVLMADQSAAMLEWAMEHLRPIPDCCTLQQADWMSVDLPPLDTILGDNSFAFVPYPDGWTALRDRLYRSCNPDARLFLRFFSVPTGYCPPPSTALVRKALCQERISYTALRTAYMFSCWDAQTCSMNMNEAVKRFDHELENFIPLVERFGLPEDNDLVTLRKYADTGITLYAPPVHRIIELFQSCFRIREVALGPTVLSPHFPLLVFEKK